MMERRERVSKIILGTFAIFFLWGLFQILSPVLLPSNSVQDLSGQTGVVDNDHITDTMPFPISDIYGCGDRLCHQRSDRSFFINGNQMPFCSRCTAIWIGLSVGLLFFSVYKVNLDERFILIIFLSMIPIGIDGVGQLLGLWESTNIVRVITGVIIGITCGIAIGIVIEEIKTWYKTKKVNN